MQSTMRVQSVSKLFKPQRARINNAYVWLCMSPDAECAVVVYLLTNLCGLDDGKVIHTGCAGAHGCSQTCGTKLHPAGETFLQSLQRSFFHQILHH